MEHEERRGTGGNGQRRQRVIVGSVASVPTAIVVAFLYQEVFKKQMDNTVAIAIASLIGSFTSVVAVCFHDLRNIFCAYLIRKRLVRSRRREERE